MSYNGFKYIIHNPIKIWNILCARGFLNWVPDKTAIKISYRVNTGKKLNLKNPQTFNEKLQWLKLYDRRPEYTTMVDKYEAKKYVASIIGEEYIIPTLGVWDSFDDIDFDKLPEQFVLKCTHDSGGLVICRDKSKLDIDAARQKLSRSLKRNYYWHGREWPYKNVQPRIIAEKYMVDESGQELKDYKFFCFDGVPRYLFIATDRGSLQEETKFDFFDMDFKHLNIKNGHENSVQMLKKPAAFDKMKTLAAALSQDLRQARLDFYCIGNNVYFGEITLFHWSGFMPFEPDSWDKTLGDWLKLPSSIKE